MKFALVYAYDPVQAGPGHGEIDEWVELDAALKAAGNFVHESGFHPAGQARTVTVRGGQAQVRAGAVIGAGTTVAGYIEVEVADEDAALSWAERVPTARYGQVEVRRIVEY
ncbi:YciI family protein [Saccharopolyspora mangrovi]|uniref:YciI family protein n=1 Tax=Saccharopolyspora mangrovi TaxID=3082379 RepID=A0ABU6AEW0_9PSEU|nr:YciI family protein [Saccharopolyspora sp. S2-29]MEB3370088.1 YciI family protein [Saccharopolyspora sp. S2-29]